MHNPDDLHGLAYAVGWEPYTLLDVAHVSRVGYAPYHTDPAQCILSACQGLDYLDHYLSDASIFQYPELLTHRIEGVLPSIPCHPGIFYADSERKASTYRPSKPCPIGLFFCRYRNRMVWTSIIVRCPSNNEISNLKPCSVSKGMRDHEYTPPLPPSVSTPPQASRAFRSSSGKPKTTWNVPCHPLLAPSPLDNPFWTTS